MVDKNYIKGIFIKEFGNYGQLSISIKVDDFIEALQEIQNEKGWANIVIAKNREATQKGYTHHCFENVWKPEKQDGPRKLSPYQAPEDIASNNNDDIPF